MATPTLAEYEARVSDPWFTQPLEGLSGITKRYVDMDHPAASDSNDGSLGAPLLSLHAPILQPIAPGTAVIVRRGSGAYTVPDGGLQASGASGSPFFIVGVPSEPRPVIDAYPYTKSGAPMPATQADMRVRQLIDASGAYGRIAHLDLRNGFRHVVVLRGHHLVLDDCRLAGAFEDTVKVANTAQDPTSADVGLISRNEILDFASQGVDHFGASGWLITMNDFHHPRLDYQAQQMLAAAIGVKGGSKNVVITRNTVHDIPGAMERGAFVLGGVGINFNMPVEDVVASDNTVTGYQGPAFMISSALRAAVVRNHALDVLMGIHLGLDSDIRASVPNAALCGGTYTGGNGFQIRPAGAFYRVAADADAAGLVSEWNSYQGLDRFVQRAALVTHAQFVAWLGTDQTSVVV